MSTHARFSKSEMGGRGGGAGEANHEVNVNLEFVLVGRR